LAAPQPQTSWKIMLNKLINRLPKGFAQFVLIGGIGFLIDAAGLYMVIQYAGLDAYTARFTTFPVPILATWLLNRRFTFREHNTSNKTREYSIYFLVQVCGLAFNFSVYSIAVYSSPFIMQYPIFAQAMGSIAAMVFNFYAVRRYAFTG
jgi:putative flippase GtrA